MQVMIIDSDAFARDELARMIKSFPGYALVGKKGSGRSALKLTEALVPDVVFLDINCHDGNGWEVARQLASVELPPAIVLTAMTGRNISSVYSQYVDGYLFKPVRRMDLAGVLQRVRRFTRAQYMAFEDQAAYCSDGTAYISARNRGSLESVPVRDILYFWADQKYTSVYHMHGELLIEKSLNSLERLLQESFIRVHRKALVARAKISAIRYHSDGGAFVNLRHVESTVPVSRRRLASVRALFDG